MSIRALRVLVGVFVGIAVMASDDTFGQQVPVRSPIPARSPTYPTRAPIEPIPDPLLSVQCLHGPGELQEQAVRRGQAIAAARVITAAQVRYKAETGRFLNLADVLKLTDLLQLRAAARDNEIAPGWHLRLSTAFDEYIFTITDTGDPCSFAFFSDTRGLIYSAQPLRELK